MRFIPSSLRILIVILFTASVIHVFLALGGADFLYNRFPEIGPETTLIFFFFQWFILSWTFGLIPVYAIPFFLPFITIILVMIYRHLKKSYAPLTRR